MNQKEKWEMPAWMELYRRLIGETGGNSIEDLMNDHATTSFNNIIRAGLIVCVNSQVQLLRRLHREGYLGGNQEKQP